MPICPVCDEHNRDKNMFCINCGEELIHMDFVKTPGSPPKKRSPRMAPSIRAMAPVSVSAPAPQATQPPIPTVPAPFPGNAMPEPNPAKPASPHKESAPPSTAPFPESVVPFPDDVDHTPGEQAAPFSSMSAPVENRPFPEDDAAGVPEAVAKSGDVPFPEDAPQAVPIGAALPFPDDEIALDGSGDALPFPDDDADAPNNGNLSFPNDDSLPNTSDAMQENVSIPFLDDDIPVTADAKEEDHVPFPGDEPDDTPTAAATGIPFPDDSEEGEPRSPIDEDSGMPFPGEEAPQPTAKSAFPNDVQPSASASIPETSSFPDAAVDATADTIKNNAMPQPSSQASITTTGSPSPTSSVPESSPQEQSQPSHHAEPKKTPGKPVTGTRIHQAVSVSVPPPSSSLPKLDQIADGGAARTKPQTSDALPRPKSPLTTVPAPVQWHRECDMCGFHNEPDAVYCGECGTAIKKKDFSESAIVQRAKLVQVSFEGGETQVFDIDNHGLAIHTETGEIAPLNQYHPTTHAIFRVAGADVQLTPPKGEHGVFVRIPPKKPTEIHTGNVIRLGHQTLLFEGGAHQYNAWGTLTTKAPSPTPKVIPLDAEDMIIGREAGHIQFTDDFLVSGTHMRIYTANGRYLIYDLASTNGTYLQVTTPYHPAPGEVFIIATKIYKTTIE